MEAKPIPGESSGRVSVPHRVVFLLDGVNEIDRADPTFLQLLFTLQRPNLLWVCSGQPEPRLQQAFVEERCTHIFPRAEFPDGLPQMDDEDIRSLLLDETGKARYAFLRFDKDQNDQENQPETHPVHNNKIDIIVKKSAGLPLYLKYLIDDINQGAIKFDDPDFETQLPDGLVGYYRDLLQRLSIGQLQALLTPLIVMLAWAKEPLDEETLAMLMVRRQVLRSGPHLAADLREGLDAVQSMVRSHQTSDGYTYELYHYSFREFIRDDKQKIIKGVNGITCDVFAELARDWLKLPAESSAQRYVLRYGAVHLSEYGATNLSKADRYDALFALANNDAFLQAQAAGLPNDPDAPLRTLRTAIEAAIGLTDAFHMAKFALRHAKQVGALQQENPLKRAQP